MRTDPLADIARQQAVLSFIVHASSKAGKTTLAGTSPKPVLVLDAEGGSKFLPYTKTYWDPMRNPPPQCDGTWEMCVVTCRDFATIQMVYNWLVSGDHCFASVVMDSITETQRKIKDSIGDFSQGNTQAKWGKLLMEMEKLVRDYRDLTLHPTNPLSVCMFIAETRQNDEGKWRPYLQGAMATSLPYLVDIVGYLYVAQVQDPVDPLLTHEQRQLLVGPDPRFEAGERVQGRLGHVVVEPRVDVMLAQIYPQFYTTTTEATPA